MPEDTEELSALLVGFLQQALKNSPDGVSVREFERTFPQKADEPADWFKTYNKRNTLEALMAIPDDVLVYYNTRFGEQYVKLNPRSCKKDHDLIDLILNEKKPSKKRRAAYRPSSRVRASYLLNQPRQSSGYRNHSSARLNFKEQYRGSSYIKKPSPPIGSNKPSSYSRSSGQQSLSPADPRFRGSSNHIVPPQIRSTSSIAQKQVQAARSISKPQTNSQSPLPPPSRHQQPTQPTQRLTSHTSNNLNTARPKATDDPLFLKKKLELRCRLQALLNRKLSEIMVLHLNSVYQLEYGEKLDPNAYGFRDLTGLLNDKEISEYVQLNIKTPSVTISLRVRTTENEKENAQSETSRQSLSRSTPQESPLANISNTSLSVKSKIEAVDPFNIKSMLYSLDPFDLMQDKNAETKQIEDIVKYRTVRIIFKSPEHSIKLEDWQAKFENETGLRIKIGHYGFESNLAFFKALAMELPIKIHLKSDEWVAVADLRAIQGWIYKELSACNWKVLSALDKTFELFATPSDTYSYNESDTLVDKEYKNALILSIKPSNSLWLRILGKEADGALLSIESSMNAYEDYKKNDLFVVNMHFVRPGLPCAAFDKTQQLWCRALILKSPSKVDKNYEVLVLLVDYGVERKFSVKDLYCLLKSHLNAPVGPIYSRLFGVKNEGLLEVQKQTKHTLQYYTNPAVPLGCKFLSRIPSGLPPYSPSSRFEVTLVDSARRELSDRINASSRQDEVNTQ